jgi:hypothetical protein
VHRLCHLDRLEERALPDRKTKAFQIDGPEVPARSTRLALALAIGRGSTLQYIPTLGSRLSDCLDGDGEVVRWVCGGKGTAVEVSGRRERCGCIDASQSQESVGAALVDVEGIEEVRLEVNALSSIGVRRCFR